MVDLGVDWLGFPFRLDHHPEDLTEQEAKAIIATLPPTVTPVLITYLTEAREILDLSRFLGTRLVQLHGPARPDLGRQLKNSAPELGLIRSLIARPAPIAEWEAVLEAWAPWVGYFLTDSYDPETGASGATGKTHDWEISRKLASISKRPLLLAGGLHSGNVTEAIRRVRPAGVDAHTGVENASGAKDPERLRSFVAAARQAFSEIGLENSEG